MSFHQRVWESFKDRARARARGARYRREFPSRCDECMADGVGVPPFSLASIFLEVHMSIRDLLGRAPQRGNTVQSQDEHLAQRCPRLFELMTSREALDGKEPRQVCTLTIVAEDGVWKAGLRERDCQMSLWISAATCREVFDGLEKALSRDPIEWRRTSPEQTRNRK